MNATTTSPVLSTLRREMDRIFDRVWEGVPQTTVLGDWMTAVDVSETPDVITVQVEVPGVDPKDLKVTLKDQTLMIRGEKRRDIERSDASFYMFERSYGSVVRNVHLPSNVDMNKVSAMFRNGVLTVTLDKAAESKGSPINIKVA
jgi:HSP20 family protein